MRWSRRKLDLSPKLVGSSDSPFVRALTIISVIAMVLFGLFGWVGLILAKSMRETTLTSMRSVHAGNLADLDAWFAEGRADADSLIGDDALVSAARALLRGAPSQAEAPLQPETPSQDGAPSEGDTSSEDESVDRQQADALAERMSSHSFSQRYVGWMLVTTDSVVVASDFPEQVGGPVPIPQEAITRIVARSTTVCLPFPDNTRQSHRSVMCAMAPVAHGGRALGAIALLIDPDDRFVDCLATTRLGETGETYAFDRQGRLLTRSRFEQRMRDEGRLASEPPLASPRNIWIRLPGPGGDQVVEPLTLMAGQALRGGSGENAQGYVNYMGDSVIGVWSWLPEYKMAVATEMSVSEAFGPECLMWRMYFIGLGLIGLCGVGSLAAGKIRRDLWPADGVAKGFRRLGPYELRELIGEGGMGAVYRGHHDVLKRDVAVKVLEHKHVNAQSIARFEREVRLTARLRHPNTIAIYDYGRTDDGGFFYVMEYVDGITIQELIDEFGRQPAERVIYLLLQICGSISEAHQLSLVHRDVKPANILVTARAGLYDMVKVLDFGLVKQIDRESTELTQTDAITGTPMYMSPESVRDAAAADERSDLYSIGAVGYALLTGLPTFDEGDASVDICLKQLNEDPVRPSERIGCQLPEDLQNVLMSCLRKDPDERPRSVDELCDALRQCADAHQWTASDAYRWWAEIYADADPPRADARASDVTRDRDTAIS